ncbi:hypothetical protein D3C81_837930 [compost metagenome]
MQGYPRGKQPIEASTRFEGHCLGFFVRAVPLRFVMTLQVILFQVTHVLELGVVDLGRWHHWPLTQLVPFPEDGV